MKSTPVVLLALATAFAAAPASAQAGYGSSIVRCESNDGRTRECPVGYARDVRLVRQLSRSPCVEGDNWGHDRRTIWVTRGCRGEFVVEDRHYGGGWDRPDDTGGLLRCESNDGRWQRCPADTRGGVELVRQLSRSACVRDQSWGVDRGGIWVNGGCRADFQVIPRRGGGYGPDRFVCESPRGARNFCPADGRGTVRLVRQLSRAACIEGRTWGRERGGVWVVDGCRAEFQTTSRWPGRD